MSTPAVQNPSPANGGESKSSRKKKAKEGGANGATPSPAVPEAPVKDNSSHGDGDGTYEHPYIKELAKQIRNAHKKLTGYQKIDAVIADNPNVSLDDLVAQRKINNDQRAAALKKPQLQQNLAALEEQISQYRKFDAEYQTQLQKQKDDLTAQHEKELEKVKDELRVEGVTTGAAQLQKKLLLFSQFLRAAAAKRSAEAEEDIVTDEGRAFEGCLLLVYGGDEAAVEAAMKLIEGADEQVPGIDGALLPVKYSQVKQAAIDHAPFHNEETWVDSVAEANAAAPETEAVSDPTVAHAGLTELDTAGPNGLAMDDGAEAIRSPPQGDAGDTAGNAAGDRWDTTSGAEKSLNEDDYKIVPRPQDELETPNSAGPAGGAQEKGLNWADEPPSYESAASGNLAGESWDTKAAGDQSDNWAGPDGTAQPTGDGWGDGATDSATGTTQEEGDGFHQVPGRHRGRGGRGRGGDGEFRGRGRGGRGGFRGEGGEFRGRGRGGFRGGRGEMGEFRGRGSGFRGRGFRGSAEGQPRGS